MMQAFVIVLREGFEAFLIVAIMFAYLKKVGQAHLLPAVKYGVAASIVLSGILGYLLMLGANEPLWEGIAGLVAAVLVTWLVVHMWQTAPRLKSDMEKRLNEVTAVSTGKKAYWGVFLFTTLMIAREGMETVLLLMQVHDQQVVTGVILGIGGALLMAFLWAKLGYLINLKAFFQVTAIFLLLFVGQILIYTFHEFTEVGLFPNSEYWHVATEPFSPDGRYGQWISTGTVVICFGWLVIAWLKQFFQPQVRTKRL